MAVPFIYTWLSPDEIRQYEKTSVYIQHDPYQVSGLGARADEVGKLVAVFKIKYKKSMFGKPKRKNH